jgi:3-deoxy-7-phosphoheptulonate synthase
MDVSSFKHVGRKPGQDARVVRVGGVEFGGSKVVLIAGPCAIETEEQTLTTARWVKRHGATILRGDAYKARSSPYTFQGLAEEGLKLLQRAGEETGLPTITEVMDAADVALVSQYVDILKVGARNSQNFTLLRAVGKAGKPVVLKRGLAMTLEEWLYSAEHIANAECQDIILCERGIRTFEKATRNTFDASIIPLVHRYSVLLVIADPSHASGLKELVEPVALAGVAAGADAVMVDVHPEPSKALCDGPQALTFPEFPPFVQRVRSVARAVGRDL